MKNHQKQMIIGCELSIISILFIQFGVLKIVWCNYGEPKNIPINAISTMSLFLASLITPLATIAIDLSRGTDGIQYLEFICVWCQYGATDNNPNGTSMILNFTSLDFFYLWIPILILFGLSFIPFLKSFPNLEISKKISDGFAINLLWGLATLALLLRFSLTYLITLKKAEFQELFPNNLVFGELGWGAASLIIASISAATSAMLGFIEFQYDIEESNTAVSN